MADTGNKNVYFFSSHNFTVVIMWKLGKMQSGVAEHLVSSQRKPFSATAVIF